MTGIMRDKKEAIEKLLWSGGYLIRGVREGSLVLGAGGGIWATDSIELAKTFGDNLELIPKPKKILETDMFALAGMVGKDDFSELTAEEWSRIRELLLDRGYDAVCLGEGHMDGANDYWILDGDVERMPVELMGFDDKT